MEWQPIETAPKDGTKFLAYCVGNGGSFVGEISAYFFEPARKFEYWGGPYSDGFECNVEEAVGKPTHWMPLPEPPKS